MWVNKYNPTEKGWYLVKINGVKDPLTWNVHNQFWCGLAGKTYKPDQIDCWLDDTKISTVSYDKAKYMREQANGAFELTKGFTTQTKDTAMMTTLEFAAYIQELTNGL